MQTSSLNNNKKFISYPFNRSQTFQEFFVIPNKILLPKVFLVNHLQRVEESYFCKTLSCSIFDADPESIIKKTKRAHCRYIKHYANSYRFMSNLKTNIILLPKVFLVSQYSPHQSAGQEFKMQQQQHVRG